MGLTFFSCAIANNQNCMIEVVRTASVVLVNAPSVKLETVCGGINTNSNGSDGGHGSFEGLFISAGINIDKSKISGT